MKLTISTLLLAMATSLAAHADLPELPECRTNAEKSVTLCWDAYGDFHQFASLFIKKEAGAFETYAVNSTKLTSSSTNHLPIPGGGSMTYQEYSLKLSSPQGKTVSAKMTTTVYAVRYFELQLNGKKTILDVRTSP